MTASRKELITTVLFVIAMLIVLYGGAAVIKHFDLFVR